MSQMEVKKGSEIELTIDSLAYGGRGVARLGKLVIFVANAIPGQTVRALVYRKKSGYAEARSLEILQESRQAVDPPCAHFPTCGGCKVQQLDYSQQLEQKQRQVEDIFKRQAGIADFRVNSVIPAENIYHYRNKMEFTFSNRRWILPVEPQAAQRQFALGLHIPGRFDRVLDITECWLQQPVGNAILNCVRDIAIEHKLKPYDVKTHIGFLRHLVLRFGVHTGDIMVNIVTAYENSAALEPVVKALWEQFSQITSIVNNINTRKADIAFGECEVLLHGRSTIEESIGKLTFEISANSFFQTNTNQAQNLYDAVLDGARLTGSEVVYDLYCGTGAISLVLARNVKEAHGFEIISTAVEDATRNAVANGIGNAYFHRADLDKYFKPGNRQNSIPEPHVIVLDPPRAGIHKHLVAAIPELKAQRIVYVSCNPTTQARDIAKWLYSGYSLRRFTLVDMFPHTPHIETVAVLTKDE